MSRKNSPLIVGDFWLDKRRDGKAKDIWQIASYDSASRSVVYQTTKCKTEEVDRASEILRAHEANQRSMGQQHAREAELLPHLFHYLREHGPDVQRLDTIESSFRAWVGFLMQDELTTGAKVHEINKISVARFRHWRMQAHSWEIEWGDKVYRHRSKGVTGEAVQRNIEDLRSALNHAEDAGRIESFPKIPSVPKNLRSKPRNLVFSTSQLGAIVAYADQEPQVQHWLLLMLATGARPDAALAFSPKDQWLDNVIDLHPIGAPLTDKRNVLVPVITPIVPILKNWGGAPALSHKTWWRTMRTKLDLDPAFRPKTIRHTVATHLRNSAVPGEQISMLLGHKDRTDTLAHTTEWYTHPDPLQMHQTIVALTKLWHAVQKEAKTWRADHLLTITASNHKIIRQIKGPNSL